MLGMLVSLAVASTVEFSYAQDTPDTSEPKHIGLQLEMPQAFAQTVCDSIDTTGRNVVEVNLVGVNTVLPLINGNNYSAMTFNEMVPGPTVRATQGDVIKVQLTAPGSAHSVDFHPGELSATNFKTVLPGETHEFCFIAETPGAFKYHCAGIDLAEMDQHVLSGMYGSAIIDPLGGYKRIMTERTVVGDDGKIKLDRKFYGPETLEFIISYSQLYLDSQTGYYDRDAMEDHEHNATVVNGMQFGYVPNEIHNLLVTGNAEKNLFHYQPWNELELQQYQSQPLYVPAEHPVKLFIENVGNEPVYLHIVGEMLTRVTQGGRIQSGPIESWVIGGSQNAIIDVVFESPGVYAMVNHDYAAINTGATTVFVVGDPFDLNPILLEKGVIEEPVSSYAEIFGNPFSAIPPLGPQSIPHPLQNIQGLITDRVAEEMKASGDYVALWEEAPKLLEKLSLPLP